MGVVRLRTVGETRPFLSPVPHLGYGVGMEEYWRSVPDAPVYLVSDLGRVGRISVAKSGTGPIGSMRVLKPCPNSHGYMKVCLGRARQEYVHRLVAVAFIGPCPDGFEVDHLDFNPRNNALFNLRYLEAEQNWARKQASQWRDAA